MYCLQTRPNCLSICLSAALAQLTDKMDPDYIIALEPSGFHDNAHVKKKLAT